jgi:hypothetical protein
MKKILLITALAGVLLAACQSGFSADLNMSDVIEARETGETVFTSATFEFEFTGDEQDKQAAFDFLSERLYEAGNFREETRDSDTFLLVDFRVPVVYAATLEDIRASDDVRASVAALAMTPGDEGLAAHIAFNQPLFDDLNEQAQDQFDQRMGLQATTIRIFLTNDLPGTINITLYSVYADDAPVPYSRALSLERGDRIEIRFSNVLTDSLGVPLEPGDDPIRVRKFADIVIGTE